MWFRWVALKSVTAWPFARKPEVSFEIVSEEQREMSSVGSECLAAAPDKPSLSASGIARRSRSRIYRRLGDVTAQCPTRRAVSRGPAPPKGCGASYPRRPRRSIARKGRLYGQKTESAAIGRLANQKSTRRPFPRRRQDRRPKQRRLLPVAQERSIETRIGAIGIDRTEGRASSLNGTSARHPIACQPRKVAHALSRRDFRKRLTQMRR